MIIENPDAFKSWLTSILDPLCDADPAALAKYVYALVKKDKPLDELKEGMLDQLDVFLQHETKPFVDMLFKSLESQEYLQAGEKKPPSPPPEAVVEKEPEVNNHVPPPPPPEPPLPEEPPAPPAAPPARHRVVMTRNVAPPPARAVPNEQTLVKVLPTELLEEPVDQLPRRRDRRADSLRDKEERRRRRSRSWERRARAARHRHQRDNDNVDRRRVVSRSPSPRGRYRNRSPPPADRPNSHSRSRSPVPVREREHERERDRLRIPRELERDRISRDRDHRDRLSRSKDRDRSRERSRDRSRGSLSPRDSRPDIPDAYKRRCRDFDEKGYCMRGDLCQWDHGADPLVLEDAALTRVLTAPPPVAEYNPLAPDIWHTGAPGFAPYPHPRPLPPRELVPIPRVRQEAVGLPPPPRHPPPHKKNFDYNRLGAPRVPQSAHSGNCSLEVKKVPRGLNDITHLNNHFGKFGKIVNIQVCFEGDPEAALITFSNPTEASVAYKSTEAVLNNRFIKVFWHNHENKQENMPPTQQQKPQPERQNNHPMSHNKVLINRDNIKATNDKQQQLEKAKEPPKEQQTPTNGQGVIKKDPPPKPIEKSKQVMEMSKRAQALLEKQLQQQTLLIDKLESGNVTGPQKAALMEAIQSAQEGIEKLRKELFAYNGTLRQMQANAKKPRTRQEAEKEILDAELDMFTKQQEGQDVTELMKRIAELRRQMAIHFPPHPAMRRPHPSLFRGGRYNTINRTSRGGHHAVFSVNQSVDHRPRALLISGFEADELDALVQHFLQFGEVTNKEVNLAVPELVLQYKLRAHAELAAANGRHYNDRTLSVALQNSTLYMLTAEKVRERDAGFHLLLLRRCHLQRVDFAATITWVANTKPMAAPEARATHHNGESNEENKEPEASQEISEDALLRFDEEEEDDAEEDRSWRR